MTKPKISAAKVPLQNWIAQIWVEAYRQWFDLPGCPYFKNPDHAIAWGIANTTATATATATGETEHAPR